MSLYNVVLGMSPLAGPVLSVLGLTPEALGRFRDVFVNVENGEPVLGVYARIGGPNRGEHRAVFEALETHPLYLRDVDAAHDSTYATIWFKAPVELRDVLLGFVAEYPYVSPEQRFQDMLDALKV